MSSRDGPSLSDRERAILDSLAAKAAADDPSLAAALGGHRHLPSIGLPALPLPLRHWSVGLVVALAGLVIVVVSLSSSVALGVAGAVLAFAGTARAAFAAPWVPGRSAAAPPAPPPAGD
jgi:hypothetical protein